MTDSQIRVAIVDDQELVRMGLRMMLEANDVAVAWEAADGAEAIERAADGSVDVILMDVRMPGVDGIAATERITAAAAEAIERAADGSADVILMDVRMPGVDGIAATEQITAAADAPRVIVLTTFDLDEYAFEALRAGASGFLLKDARPDALLGAIRAVHAGDAALAPRMTARMIEEFVSSPGPRAPSEDPRLGDLTPREREILVAIGEGLTNDELAARFFLSVSTVKTHIGRLLQKLHARDRVQLVILAYEAGLVGR